MPEDSRRIFESYTVRFSKTVEAPLKYVYAWCTDFRNDDGKLSKSNPQFKVLRIGEDRVVRIRTSNPRAKPRAIAIELVRLNPPDAWHVDQIDETDLAAVDYKVSRLGLRRTRVTLDITERWLTPKHPGRFEYLRDVSGYWDTLMAALENRYRRGRPARG